MELDLEKYPKQKNHAYQKTSCGNSVARMWINTHFFFYGNVEQNFLDAFPYNSGNGKRLFPGHVDNGPHHKMETCGTTEAFQEIVSSARSTVI